jgi:hypothetical protein
MNVRILFRKYHRALSIVLCLPLLLTVLTGIGYTMISEWSLNLGLTRSLMIKLHTGEIFHLQGIYPILNGVGLLGLLVTGISLSGLFRPKVQKNS